MAKARPEGQVGGSVEGELRLLEKRIDFLETQNARRRRELERLMRQLERIAAIGGLDARKIFLEDGRLS